MLPAVTGEFSIVADPEIRFTQAGKAWLKIRGKAADRVKDASGNWGDGDVMFIDIIVGFGAGLYNDSTMLNIFGRKRYIMCKTFNDVNTFMVNTLRKEIIRVMKH